MIYELLDMKTKSCLYITDDFEKACRWAQVYKDELNIEVLLQVRA